MNWLTRFFRKNVMRWEDFAPGKRVVCIHDFTCDAIADLYVAFGNTLPVKGKVYTVRDQVRFSNGLNIRLIEIVNPILSYESGDGELWFTACLFRPIDETKIDVFRRFLASPGKMRSVKSVSPVRYVDGGLV